MTTGIGAAETILTGGKIVSGDDAGNVHECLAVKDGRILAVGANEDLAPVISAETSVIDLTGRTALPGLIDTHGHLALFAPQMRWVDLSGTSSVAEIQERVRKRAAETPKGEWILTTPVGDMPYHFHVPGCLQEGRWPTRWDLDEATQDHPVYITVPRSRVPSVAVLNTEALSRMGVDAEHPGEHMGVTLRGEHSTERANGQVVGLQPPYRAYGSSPFHQRLDALLPPITYEELRSCIERAAASFLETGVTTIVENHLTTPRELRAYSDLKDADALPLRVFFAFELFGQMSETQIETAVELLAFSGGVGFGTDDLRVIGVSAGLDGPHWHGKAVSTEPYAGPFGDLVDPEPLLEPEKLDLILRTAARHGVRVHVEAAGRGSIGIALEALSRLDEGYVRTHRPILQHAEFPTHEHIAACARMGIVPTTSTNFLWGKGTEVFLERLGPEWAKDAIPLRSWLDAGVPVCQSTDWGPRSAMFTMWQSIARQAGYDGSTIGPEQSISRNEALRLYTLNGAYALGLEDRLGSLEPGKHADVIVCDEDPLTCDLEDLPNVDVVATMIAGNFVRGRSQLDTCQDIDH